jgi:hypothetical protein
LLGKKEKKRKNPTIERGKILIPFIILGAKLTSTPGPKRSQPGSSHLKLKAYYNILSASVLKRSNSS